MDIAIFNDLTTEDAINQLEQDGKKYEGLYVDMEDKESRKYVKEQAVAINDLIKKVDRKRIDESKRYKAEVEKEAASIIGRLKVANEPYTLLIDAHKEERAKILAAEKLVIETREAAEQKELDHEMAILMNKTFEFDKSERLRIATERDEEIKKKATIDALEQQERIVKAQEQDRINAENARLANIEHVRSVNLAILDTLIDNGIDEESAKTIIRLAAKRQLPNLTINY